MLTLTFWQQAHKAIQSRILRSVIGKFWGALNQVLRSLYGWRINRSAWILENIVDFDLQRQHRKESEGKVYSGVWEQLDEERNWLSFVAVEKIAKKSLCVDVSDLQVQTFLYP